MNTLMRIEIRYKAQDLDGRSKKLLHHLKRRVTEDIQDLRLLDVYLSNDEKITPSNMEETFVDKVAQEYLVNEPFAKTDDFPGWTHLIEVAYRAGVTDPVAITAREALETVVGRKLTEETKIQTAAQYLIEAENLSARNYEQLQKALFNPLVQQAVCITREEWNAGSRPPILYSYRVLPSPLKIDTFPVASMNDDELLELSRARLLALTLEEMWEIRRYYSRAETIAERTASGLTEDPTDVEIEMLAQTWSEHCKHKILNAKITYREGEKTEEIDSLFNTCIKGTTEKITRGKTYLRSVFHDNSGVIEFDEKHLICFKVETHNSPSALDPYGGSITGIVGVNRDIMGTGKGAKPIFNTNVLCFADPGTKTEEIPEGLLHPQDVLAGVHHGIVDGGNQSGIPTVAGAFLFDDSYVGKPLVFCGTGGILPAEIHGEGSWIKHIDTGDLAVMLGGRIGKDGIHGATFSSLALNDESPVSAVQIGDPITQKKMQDFLLEARDLGLYKGITDNGAGGLSSSLGEMAEYSGGIKIDLHRCPLKYQGLAPWEILVSESQERMSLAVSTDQLDKLLSLAAKRGVEATVVGTFTDSGFVEIFHQGGPVGKISMEFLHDGLPPMRLTAEWIPPLREESIPGDMDPQATLLALLADPNIASKESLIRQYDHEVRAQSIMKPFVGAESTGPSDGAVLKPLAESCRGITITHGVCPRYGDLDTYHMAMCAVDEAYRAHIACGGDPDLTSALDNFCWPDPVTSESTLDGSYKLAQLVRANRGLQDACIAYRIPLISGKDSMKNDTNIGGRKISVRPTLLISLMGIIRDIRKTVTSDFKTPGELIYILGATRGELGGSSLERLTGKSFKGCPRVFPGEAMKRYRVLSELMQEGLVSACHDISDGGLGVALGEMVIGGGLGAEISLDNIPGKETDTMETSQILFCESPSRFVVTVPEKHRKAFVSRFLRSGLSLLGRVTGDQKLLFSRGGKEVCRVGLSDLNHAWNSFNRRNQ